MVSLMAGTCVHGAGLNLTKNRRTILAVFFGGHAAGHNYRTVASGQEGRPKNVIRHGLETAKRPGRARAGAPGNLPRWTGSFAMGR
jgi:hypothetical protein